MRDFLAFPFWMIGQVSDWAYAFISGDVVVKMVMDQETAEEFISQMPDDLD